MMLQRSKDNAKVLITGGAGFVGFHTARKFAENGRDVTCLDIADFETSSYPENTKFLNGDVCNFDQMNMVISKGFEVIIHAAAGLPLWKKKDIFDVNVKGTRNILEAAHNNFVGRVVYISSTAVYGIPKVHPLYEDSKLIGVGSYGKSKIQAEELCAQYRKKDLCVPIIRPKTVIGTERLGVFQILYDWIECGKKIPIIGNGENRYQLLEIEDLVDAIWLLSTKDKIIANDTFNVGAKNFCTILEDIGALCQYANSGASIMKTPGSVVKFFLRLFELMGVSPLYKWVYDTADTDSFVSTEKIEKKLGWMPKYSNSDALMRSYQWYLDNKTKIPPESGITHRIGWDQGILKLFKKLL